LTSNPFSSNETLFLDYEQDLQSPTATPAEQILEEHRPFISAKDDGDQTTMKRARNTIAAQKFQAQRRVVPGYEE